MSWEAPGYVADTLLGFGASGEVWRGRDVETGDVVALKRLRVGLDPAEHHALSREAALLAAFRHPHVIALRAAVCTRDGLVLVLDHAAGGSVGGLLARQGRLPGPRVAAIIADVAGALAAAHAVGLVHGDISGGNVLLDGTGRPLLADLGTARLLAEGGAPARATPGFADPALTCGAPNTAASDVYALGALGALALLGPAVAADPAAGTEAVADPGALAVLLGRMLKVDALARPSAAEVAVLARQAAGATGSSESSGSTGSPGSAGSAGSSGSTGSAGSAGVAGSAGSAGSTGSINSAGSGGVGPSAAWPRDPGWEPVERLSAQALTHATRAKPAADPPMVIAGRHRSAPARDDGRGHRGRLAAAVLLTVCALVSAAVVGFRWGGRALPEPASTVTPVALSWPQVWAGLDDRRARAFATGDATLLAGVYQPDCPALPPDLRAVRALANRQVHAVGVRHQATTVRAVSAGADTATLLVTDRMNSYQVRDSADQLVSEAPPRAARTLRAELVRTQRGWRIASLTRA